MGAQVVAGLGVQRLRAGEQGAELVLAAVARDPRHPGGDLDRARPQPRRPRAVATARGALRRLEQQAIGLVSAHPAHGDVGGLGERPGGAHIVRGEPGRLLEQLLCAGGGASLQRDRARLRDRLERGRLALAPGVELGRLREVKGDQLDQLAVAPGGARPQAGRGELVQAHPLGPGQRGVADVADQLVVEAVDPRLTGPRADQMAALELGQRLGHRFAPQLGQGRLREPFAEHRCQLQGSLLALGESVDARGDRRLHGVGQRRPGGSRPGRHRVCDLLGEERVSGAGLARSAGSAPGRRRRRAAPRAPRSRPRVSGRSASRWWPSAAPRSGRRPAISGRAVQITSRGEPGSVALASSSSRKPSSAQCASSTAITSGRSARELRQQAPPGPRERRRVDRLAGARERGGQGLRRRLGVGGPELREPRGESLSHGLGAGVVRARPRPPGGSRPAPRTRSRRRTAGCDRSARRARDPRPRARRAARAPAGSCRPPPRR